MSASPASPASPAASPQLAPSEGDDRGLSERSFECVRRGAYDQLMKFESQALSLCVRAARSSLAPREVSQLHADLSSWVIQFGREMYVSEYSAQVLVALLRMASENLPEVDAVRWVEWVARITCAARPPGPDAAFRADVARYHARILELAADWGLRTHQLEHIEACLAEIRTNPHASATELVASGLELCVRITAQLRRAYPWLSRRGTTREVAGLVREARHWAINFALAYSATAATSRDLWVVYELVQTVLVALKFNQADSAWACLAEEARCTQRLLDTMATRARAWTRCFEFPGFGAVVEHYRCAIYQIAKDGVGVAHPYATGRRSPRGGDSEAERANEAERASE